MKSQNSLDILISNINEKNNDNSVYEEDVAQKLDEFLKNNAEKLMSIPINRLVIIFNHPKRKLSDHNLAYQLIKDYSEKKNDLNILFKYLDGSKLSSENMTDAISSKDKRNGFLPSIDFSKMYEANIKLNSLEENVKTMNQTIDSLKSSILSEVAANLQKIKDEIKETISNDVSLLTKKLENELDSYKSQNKREKEQLMADIRSYQNQFNEEFNKKIDEKSKELNKKIDTEIGLQEKSLMFEIKSVSRTLKDDLNSNKTSMESQMETIYANNKKTVDSYKSLIDDKLNVFSLKNENEISNLKSKLDTEISNIKRVNESNLIEINSFKNIFLEDKSILSSCYNQKIKDEIDKLRNAHTEEISKMKQSNIDEIEKLRNTLIGEISKTKQLNSDEIEKIRNAQTEEISKMKQFNINEIEKLRKTHTEEISKIKQSNIDEIEKLRNTITGEISKTKQLNSDEIEKIRKTQTEEISKMKQFNINEIEKLRKTHTEEISKMKQSNIDEIEKLSNTITGEISKTKQLNSDEIKLLKNDIADEIAELKKENKNNVSSMKTNILNEIPLMKINNDSLSSVLENHSKEISFLNSTIETHKNDLYSIKSKQNDINSMKSELDTMKKEQRSINKYSFLITSEGILANLKKREANQFDRFFVASQSSNDIYNLLDPNSNDKFTSPSGCKDYFIEFNLKDPIDINGITIYNHEFNFPRSFDVYIDDDLVRSISNANELNGSNRSMRINFTSKKGNKLRIKQTGSNWNYEYDFCIKRIEIHSSDSKYSEGVFKTILQGSENNNVHKCPIIISSTQFDHNHFHMLNSSSCIGIYGNSNSWFQVELTKGKARVFAFRLLKRSHAVCVPNFEVFGKYTLKSFKIVGTDEFKEDINSWTTLIDVNDKNEDESNPLDIYKLPRMSDPIKYIRIILTGPSFENLNNLIFFHFDFFGEYSD